MLRGVVTFREVQVMNFAWCLVSSLAGGCGEKHCEWVGCCGASCRQSKAAGEWRLHVVSCTSGGDRINYIFMVIGSVSGKLRIDSAGKMISLFPGYAAPAVPAPAPAAAPMRAPLPPPARPPMSAPAPAPPPIRVAVRLALPFGEW